LPPPPTPTAISAARAIAARSMAISYGDALHRR
jgi:hypothetical protein